MSCKSAYDRQIAMAYDRQIAMIDKDCRVESEQGQQSYNICMGQAGERVDKDLAGFYSNLQMLGHDQDQLTALQAFEMSWRLYTDSGTKATDASWPDGTGASEFASQVYLSLVRNHMRELYEICGLNVSQ